MGRTWVATDDLAAGTLPRLCVRTGRPTEHTVRASFARAPVPVVGRIVPVGLVRPFASAVIDGRLPMLPDVSRRARRLAAVRDGALAAAVVALVVAVVIGGSAGFALLVLALAAALVAAVWTAVGVATVVSGRVDETGDWVELRNVADAFVAASDERYADEEEPVEEPLPAVEEPPPAVEAEAGPVEAEPAARAPRRGRRR